MKKLLSTVAFLIFAGGMTGLQAATIQIGDVFASITTGGVGQVWWYRANGVLVAKLSTSQSGMTAGSAFDSFGNLYVTDFNGNRVSEFDTSGNLIGTFGSGYHSDPESIVFDAAGKAFVGQADGTHNVLKFDSSGASLNTFAPAIENRGTDWITLAADQHTLYYTSSGTSIKRFDTSTSTQLSDFATGLPGDAHALRLLSGGGVLVADTGEVVRLNSIGLPVQSYTIPGTTILFPLNLDSDGTSFWTGDLNTANLYKVNIATGVVEETINTGATGFEPLNGVSVFAGIPTSNPPVPEPASLLLLGSGLVGAYRWRKQRNRV